VDCRQAWKTKGPRRCQRPKSLLQAKKKGATFKKESQRKKALIPLGQGVGRRKREQNTRGSIHHSDWERQFKAPQKRGNPMNHLTPLKKKYPVETQRRTIPSHGEGKKEQVLKIRGDQCKNQVSLMLQTGEYRNQKKRDERAVKRPARWVSPEQHQKPYAQTYRKLYQNKRLCGSPIIEGRKGLRR